MPSLQAVFIVALCIMLPLLEIPRWRRLKANSTSAARLGHYREVIVLLWALAAVSAWLAAPATLLDAPGRLGGMEWLTGSATASWLVQGGALLLVGMLAAQALRSLTDEQVRQQYAQAAQPLKFMLPAGRRERRWWIAVAISAGVCEELVYRGFMLAYFGQPGTGLGLGLGGAWLLSTLAFGLVHAYQGLAGVLRSGIVGGLLGLVAIASGHLALAIVLHVVIDLLPLAYYRPAAGSVEGVAEVGDQVGRVLDADRNPDQRIGDPH